MYADLYGSEFKTKDISTLYTLYEQELQTLNMVVSVCLMYIIENHDPNLYI